MSKERLMQWIALAANAGTIVGLLMVIMQLQQNRTLMRAQVRHELASTIVDLLNTPASNSQLASVLRRGGLGEPLTDDEQFQFRLRSNALFRYWEDVHYQYRNGLYDGIEVLEAEGRLEGNIRQLGRARQLLARGPDVVFSAVRLGDRRAVAAASRHAAIPQPTMKEFNQRWSEPRAAQRFPFEMTSTRPLRAARGFARISSKASASPVPPAKEPGNRIPLRA